MTIDPHRPVHVVFAAPWEAVSRNRDTGEEDRTWWSFPDHVTDGDTVVTVVDAREPAIIDVSVLRMDSDDDWDLAPAEPHLFEAIAVAAIEKRVGFSFSIDPRTLHRTEGAAVLKAVDAESTSPTPWYELPNSCSGADRLDTTREGRLWGCTACGRDWEGGFRPRHQQHVSAGWPFDAEDEPVVVCPSCHDILHQPLGPTFDELMFSHRPACPRCDARRTYKRLMGMPPGPPPYGTIAGGCVVTGEDDRFLCGVCDHGW